MRPTIIHSVENTDFSDISRLRVNQGFRGHQNSYLLKLRQEQVASLPLSSITHMQLCRVCKIPNTQIIPTPVTSQTYTTCPTQK